jgi:hypothetical protein
VPSADRRRACGVGQEWAEPYVTTASGINPANSQLVCFEAKVVGDRVLRPGPSSRDGRLRWRCTWFTWSLTSAASMPTQLTGFPLNPSMDIHVTASPT